MKKIGKLVAILTLIFASNSVNAQCALPEKIVKGVKDKGGFGVSTQSKSGALKGGEAYEMAFIAQANMDYKIFAAMQDPSQGTLVVELYEMVTEKDEKGNFKKEKKVISSVEQDQVIEITTDKTRKMMISVTITLEDDENKKPLCIGVLILDKKTTIIGL